MFTGIISDIGEVLEIEPRGDTRLTIACAYEPETIAIGASIACSGVCLTAIETGRHGDGRGIFVVEASADHLARSGTSVEGLHATLAELDYRSFAVRRLNFELLTAPDSSIEPGNWLCLPGSRADAVPQLERLLRRCALTPCIPGFNPLARRGRRPRRSRSTP